MLETLYYPRESETLVLRIRHAKPLLNIESKKYFAYFQMM